MVDTVKTRSDLINRALKDLGIIEPGETPSTEDYDTMDGLVDPLIAQLDADQIIGIQDTDAIELGVFIPLARLLANTAGPDFGSAINEEAKQRDEQTLRRMASAPATFEALKVSYF